MESTKFLNSDSETSLKTETLELADSEISEPLLPGLPDDFAILCLTRVPRRYHLSLKQVSKRWRELLNSKLFYSYRRSLGVKESWIYLLCRDSNDQVCLYVMDPAMRKWKQLFGLPDACLKRYGMQCEVLGNKLYLMGGCGWSTEPTNEVYCYDPLLSKWESVASMNVARCYFVSTTWKGNLYAIGGVGVDGPLTSFEVYSSDANKWTCIDDRNILPDLGESLAVDGKIYIRHINTERIPEPYAAVYDMNEKKWTVIDDDMALNWRGPAVVMENNVYMLDQTSGIMLSILDKGKHCWNPIGRLSPSCIRTPCQIVAVDNMLFIVGRGLQTQVLDTEKIGNANGIIVTSAIEGSGSPDDKVISCKTITI